MTRLLLVRHGETDHNLQKRFQGHGDQGLNARGKQMAEALGRSLEHETFHAVFSSDLRRVQETVNIITLEKDWYQTNDPRLREMDFGEWQGLTYSEIERDFPEQLNAWHTDMLTTPPPGGETLNQFAERVDAVLKDIIKGYPDKNFF